MNEIKKMIRLLIQDRDGLSPEVKKSRRTLARLMSNAKTEAEHNYWRNMIEVELWEQERQRQDYNDLITDLLTILKK